MYKTARKARVRPGRRVLMRRRVTRGLAVVGLGALVGLPALSSLPTAVRPYDPRAPRVAEVAVDVTEGGPVIPADFSGLSVEASDLNSPAVSPANGTLVNLLQSLGPGVLRFGGNAVDRTFAYEPGGKRPSWATGGYTDADLDRLHEVLLEAGWSAMLGVSLGHFDPGAATKTVQAAVERLGSSLSAIEIGNEPNLYYKGLRDPHWTTANYAAEAGKYSRLLSDILGARSQAKVAGPSAYSGVFNNAWLASVSHPGEQLTDHFYPATGCDTTVPTPYTLTAPATRRRETHYFEALAAQAKSKQLSSSIDETNSVVCSGFKGVSDVYASSLWGADYLLRAATAGVSHVNMHGGFGICDSPGTANYTPLCAADANAYAAGTLTARPLWYGLLLDRFLGGSQPLRTSVDTLYEGTGQMSAYAFRGADGLLRIVVVNLASASPRALDTAHLYVNSNLSSPFTVERLRGTALGSASGITLDGATVAADGTFTPKKVEAGTMTNGQVSISMPRLSAALITFQTPVPVPTKPLPPPVLSPQDLPASP